MPLSIIKFSSNSIYSNCKQAKAGNEFHSVIFTNTAKDGRDPEFDGGTEEFWQVALNMTAKTTNAFYCEKKCKKDRGALYPCCLRRMLEDESKYSIYKCNNYGPVLVRALRWRKCVLTRDNDTGI